MKWIVYFTSLFFVSQLPALTGYLSHLHPSFLVLHPFYPSPLLLFTYSPFLLSPFTPSYCHPLHIFTLHPSTLTFPLSTLTLHPYYYHPSPPLLSYFTLLSLILSTTLFSVSFTSPFLLSPPSRHPPFTPTTEPHLFLCVGGEFVWLEVLSVKCLLLIYKSDAKWFILLV